MLTARASVQLIDHQSNVNSNLAHDPFVIDLLPSTRTAHLAEVAACCLRRAVPSSSVYRHTQCRLTDLPCGHSPKHP